MTWQTYWVNAGYAAQAAFEIWLMVVFFVLMVAVIAWRDK
jgi:hypothetical protein